MNRAQLEIQRFISVFLYYQKEVRMIKEKKEKDRTKTDNIAKLGSLASKIFTPKARITKTSIKRSIEQAKKKGTNPLFALKLDFNRDFAELERFLEDCIMINYDGTKTTKVPLSFVSSVTDVQTVESRTNRVLDCLNRLSLLENKLTLKIDFVEPIQEEPKHEDDEKENGWLYSFLSNQWFRLIGIAFEFFLIILAILTERNIGVRITAIVLACLIFLIGLVGLGLNLLKRKE